MCTFDQLLNDRSADALTLPVRIDLDIPDEEVVGFVMVLHGADKFVRFQDQEMISRGDMRR